jgi:hypothetical protein
MKPTEKKSIATMPVDRHPGCGLEAAPQLSGWLCTNLADVRFSEHEDRRRSDATFADAGRQRRALLNPSGNAPLLLKPGIPVWKFAGA